MQGVSLIKAFVEQATARGTKATILKPLAWMISILIAASLSTFYFNCPEWLGILFAIFSGLTMLLYLIAYLYCLFTDRDALRSETYSIQKLAIEKGFVGDSISGQLGPSPQAATGFIEAKATSSVKEVAP